MSKGDRIQRIIERYDRALAGADDAVVRRVGAALDASWRLMEDQLLRSYAAHSGDLDLLPAQRKLLILQELAQYRTLLNPMQRSQLEADLTQLLSTSFEGGVRLADELAKAISNQPLQRFASVNLSAVRFQAEEASKRLYRWDEEMQRKISGVVETGLVMGAGPRKVAGVLRRELGIVKGRAEAIARTESLSSLNRAAEESYKASGLELVQVYATVDRRTCSYCQARNQRVYKLGEIQVPLHVSCRCYLAPFSKEWVDLGLVDVAASERLRRQGLDALEAAGVQPNYGLAPFEKANGMTKPPEVMWKPS